MKKAFFLLLFFGFSLLLFSVKANGQVTCPTIESHTITTCGPNSLQVSVVVNYSGSGHASIQFSCHCYEDCKQVSPGIHTVNFGPINNCSISDMELRLFANNHCGGTPCITVLLPVKLTDFSAKKTVTGVTLSWTTIDEENNTGFAVERSTDGKNWQQISFVASKASGGNSSEKLYYVYTDSYRPAALTQYRVKNVDFDGSSRYSPVAAIAGEKQTGTIVFPNPVKAGDIATVVTKNNETIVKAVLYNTTGTVMQQWESTSGSLQVYGLKPGLYILNIQTKSGKSNEKIVVQ